MSPASARVIDVDGRCRWMRLYMLQLKKGIA